MTLRPTKPASQAQYFGLGLRPDGSKAVIFFVLEHLMRMA